jgi:hypothetical protein
LPLKRQASQHGQPSTRLRGSLREPQKTSVQRGGLAIIPAILCPWLPTRRQSVADNAGRNVMNSQCSGSATPHSNAVECLQSLGRRAGDSPIQTTSSRASKFRLPPLAFAPRKMVVDDTLKVLSRADLRAGCVVAGVRLGINVDDLHAATQSQKTLRRDDGMADNDDTTEDSAGVPE